MSDYHTYYFVAPLTRAFADIEEFRAYAEDQDVYFDLGSRPMVTSSGTPSFGPSADYDGPSFSHWGLDITDGVLSIGVFASNLERPQGNDEGDDGITPPPGETRLDNILRFLSEITDGEIGEIQGTYSAEHFDYETHADPIIRCADGRLRVGRTPVTRHNDDETASVTIPGILPADLIPSEGSGSRVELDIDALIARFAPVEVTITPGIR